MFILILAISLSLSISFFCSLMEACLLSLSKSHIARIAQRSPRMANIWKQFKTNIHKPIAVILIINTLAHTIGAAVAGAKFDTIFGSSWIFVFSLAYSFIMIQYTEILPKTLGVRFNVLLARISAVPMFFLVKTFRPFISVVEFANRPFERRVQKEADSIATEISLLASSAVLENKLSQEQASLISRSIQMSQSKVRDVMVGKDDVIFLNDSMSLYDAFLASHIHMHTRYPLLTDNDYDRVGGYVNFKDLVTALHIAPEDPSLKGIRRPILFVPETMPLNILLKKMAREYQHIAIVQDAKGHTIGLVTMEDVLESLVGEIEDEFDSPPAMMVVLSENRWRIGGGVTLSRLSERAFKELPKSEQTVDELVKFHMHGREPTEHFEFEYHGIRMKVRKVARGYVYDVIAERHRKIT